ncbi:hypothetical protein D3C73_1215040 [compost metagenome]
MNGHAQHHDRQQVLRHTIVECSGIKQEGTDQHIQHRQATGGNDQILERVGHDQLPDPFERQRQANQYDHLHQHFDVPIGEHPDLTLWKPVGNQQHRLPVDPVEHHLHQQGVENRRCGDGRNGLAQRTHTAALKDGLQLKTRQCDTRDDEQQFGLAHDRPGSEHMQMTDHNEQDRNDPQQHWQFHGPKGEP